MYLSFKRVYYVSYAIPDLFSMCKVKIWMPVGYWFLYFFEHGTSADFLKSLLPCFNVALRISFVGNSNKRHHFF